MRFVVIAAAAAWMLGSLSAGEATGPVGIVPYVKVVSDKVEDVSSLEAWKKSFIKEGMSDRDKALKVWETVVKFRQQCSPPNEFVNSEGNVHDAIKAFNVYGYGQCCCASSHIEQLARYVGLQARGKGISNHSVSEVFFEDDWHLLDASLITYFSSADGKEIYSVDELCANVKEWLAANPGMLGDDKKMLAFSRGNGWKKGPSVFANSPFYNENGWLPAVTHGWYSNIGEYCGKQNFIYEYGYHQGYRVNVTLREGERITRNWSNKGLHVNMDGTGGDAWIMKTKIGEGDLAYSPKYGDIAPGRIGNGTHEYNVPLASGAFKLGALKAENLVSKSEAKTGPAVAVKDAAQPGVLIIRMPSSYVNLGGSAELNSVIGEGGEIAVSFSDNHGQDWKPVATIKAGGTAPIDLKALVYRRYDWQLKLELKGKGTGLEALKLSTDIQHSQRPLPALTQGENNITFSAGTAEGTLSYEGTLNPEHKSKNVFFGDFKPVLNGIGGCPLFMQGGKADVTFKINTPGDLTKLYMGLHYRARGKGEGFDYQVSYDDGKTWKTIDRAEGPVAGHTKHAVTTDIPAGTRAALVRFSGNQNNTCGFFDYSVWADYKEPNAGFRPVKVTYVWDENGAEKKHVHVAKTGSEAYKIKCDAKPTMKSLIVELE